MSGTVTGGALARAILRLASWLVPRARRAAWLEEWHAEVWHHERVGGARTSRDAALRCVGAVPHALWLRGEEWNVDGLWQDIRFAVRTLVKRPAFTVVAIATLGLGIGANTAVFSVVDAVVLRPLPMPNGDRLVWMWGRTFEGRPIASVSPPDFLDYAAATGQVFETFAAYSSFSGRVVFADGERPEELVVRSWTGDFLEALGFEPALGRTFTKEETDAASSDVVMISHGLWVRLFGADPDVLGRTLRMNGEPHTVVGVLPPETGFQDGVDVWQPLTFGSDDFDSRAGHFLRPLGVLRPGVSLAEAQVAMDAVSSRLEQEYPETNQDWYPLLQPLQDVVVGSARPTLLVMLGAVALVLLIACANVGNLLLARSGERRGEMAVRSALGASRSRVVRQLVVEGLLLSTAAGLVGLALAAVGIEVLRDVGSANVPRLDEVGMDGRVLAVTLMVSTVVGLVFGMLPSLPLGRGALTPALGGMGRGRGARRGARLRQGLVVGEVAVSFVLLAGALLLMRSFVALASVDPGFDERNVLALPLSFSREDVPTGEEVVALEDAMRERVAAVPGVRAVAFANVLPMSGGAGDTYVYAEGREPERIRSIENTAQLRVASEDYFTALGVPVVRGRVFDETDTPDSEHAVVINEALARRLFPEGDDPVGRGMIIALDSLMLHRIVGVVGDMRQFGPGRPPEEEFHLSARQTGARGMTLVVKGATATPTLAAVRSAVWEADPRQPLTRAATLEDYVGGALATGRFQAVLLGVFATLAVVLASVGLYGVLGQTVVERRHEIGVRLAMGARRGAVVAMIVRQGVGLIAVGLVSGGAAALALTRLLEAILFGVGARDPIAFAATPLLLGAVSLVSCWLPAVRAARTDPVGSLRAE